MAKRHRKHTRRHRRHYKRNPGIPLMPILLVAAAGAAIWYWKFRDEKPQKTGGMFLTDTRGMLLGPGQSAGMGTMLSGRI